MWVIYTPIILTYFFTKLNVEKKAIKKTFLNYIK